MTEKEKQQAGELYNGNDPELVKERTKAKKMCSEYNDIEYNDYQKRERVLGRLLPLKGDDAVIEPDFFCDYGYNIIMGRKFYSNHNLVILDCAEVTFGNNVFIGPNCGFYTAEHPIDADTRNQGLESAKPIKVGSNVWIGGNVTVLGGVTIGDNTVIGAGSVVTKDIPANCVAVGNPCKPVKEITSRPSAEPEDEAQEKPKPTPPPKPRHLKVDLVENNPFNSFPDKK
ncbi:sugar O-acetyltransferase [Ruminococcus flavefaciens]|uniref:sugar O-acetyltransferase n=1 Tax=Ruminococcus flavefaciens TaxID=1265 RepID=UPI002A913C65|nr:sugar O-acetyltransferase [Ruminococcus flavefaciens]MDY5692384.1 sugar O-acetyltransferase [Ruminococcus flavefaciens]